MPGVLDVLKVALSRAREHRLDREAAHVAYFAFLAFLSMVPLLLAFTTTFGSERASAGLVALLKEALPGAASDSIERFVARAFTARPGLLSVGAVVLLWSASNAVSALTLALNVTFGARTSRPWWHRRLLVLFVAAVGTAALAIGSILEVTGPVLLREAGLARMSGVWRLQRTPILFVLLGAAVYLLYRVLPNVDGPRARRPLLVGAVAGTAAWMAATVLFQLSLGLAGSGGSVYGTATGVISLQVWLYLTSAGLLFGAEVAAALAEARPSKSRSRGPAETRTGSSPRETR